MSYWTKQRGGPIKYKLVMITYKFLGYKVTKLLIWLITLYYSYFAKDALIALKKYYTLLQLKCNRATIHSHFYTFALVILDRVLANYNWKKPNFKETGAVALYNEMINSSKGKILISAHVGGWQIASDRLAINGSPVNILTYKQEEDSLSKLIKGKKANLFKVIDYSNDLMETTMRINNILSKGEIIAMLPDRYINKEHTSEVTFLGEKTRINNIPFKISYIKKVPVICTITLRENDDLYIVKVMSILTPESYNNINDYVSYASNIYIENLENIIKTYPMQWFNFYDFWKEEAS